MRKSIAAACVMTAIAVGFVVATISPRPTVSPLTVVAEESSRPTYGSGWYAKSFYDDAYANADGSTVTGATSAVVAHHLLVAKDIAEVFEDLANDSVKAVILVSPNHFARGISSAQVSMGQWTTHDGTVVADDASVSSLLAAVPFLKREEAAFENEHGIFGIMPFVARSFPNARVIPIVLRDELSADRAWQLGTTLATLFPDAVLVASVDMTHYQTAAYTTANDARVLSLLGDTGRCDGSPCATNLDVDSNASLRVLFGWNDARGTTDFHLTHHGSSLAMGATKDWHENTSHILGYFLPDPSDSVYNENDSP